MNIKLLGLILCSVTLSALAQMVLKLGMSSTAVQHALKESHATSAAWTVATNLQVISGLSLYFLGAAVWLLVLAKVDVSYAYPFVGVGFILTMLLGWLVLGESVGLTRLAGTMLVVSGVWLVSSS